MEDVLEITETLAVMVVMMEVRLEKMMRVKYVVEEPGQILVVRSCCLHL